MMELLRYTVTEPEPLGEPVAIVLYNDPGAATRVRIEQGREPAKKGPGKPVREADVDELKQRLSALHLPLRPEEREVFSSDGTRYELRGWSLNCGFAFRWDDEVPIGWAALKEVIAWLEARRP